MASLKRSGSAEQEAKGLDQAEQSTLLTLKVEDTVSSTCVALVGNVLVSGMSVVPGANENQARTNAIDLANSGVGHLSRIARTAGIDLGTLGGDSSSANAINDRGLIVGSSETATGDEHAFLWQEGKMIDLGTLGGANSGALDINEEGQIVGTSTIANGDQHAYRWHDGAMIDLGTLGGGTSTAIAIDSGGQVVGWATTDNNETHAFLWRDGTMIDLGTLEVHDTASTAAAIGKQGQVVGVSGSTDGMQIHGFLWQDDKMTDLGPLGDVPSQLTAINSDNQIVGTSVTEGMVRAFLWQDGTLEVLNTLGTWVR